MSDVRYAIFFVPPADCSFYRFGAAALGYDSYSGSRIPSLSSKDVSAAEWEQLTAEPRRYGFHATLKAPFGLLSEFSESQLIAEFSRFVNSSTSALRFTASIQLLDGFAALVPSGTALALDLLAARCVRHFDPFRRPLTKPEQSRRLGQRLTARQISHLDRWGYPYVFEDFRFHMTLTGRLPAGRTAAALGLLRKTFKQQSVPGSIAIERIALLRQDGTDAPFRVIHEAALHESLGSVGPSIGDALSSDLRHSSADSI
jgi:hypothetical protein